MSKARLVVEPRFLAGTGEEDAVFLLDVCRRSEVGVYTMRRSWYDILSALALSYTW
jgi:hypothetical protein